MSYDIPPEDTSYSVPNSTMAVVSLIAGILGLTFFPVIGSIAAIITGIMGRKEVQESGGTLGGEGMATAGLAMGVIGLGLGVLCLCIFGFSLGIPFCIALSEGQFLVIPGLFALLF